MKKYSDYPTCERTYVTFCVTGEDLVPDDVSVAMDIVPTRVNIRGELRRKSSTVTNKLGGWFLSSQDLVPSADVRLHLEWLLNQIVGKQDALNWMRQKGWSPVVSCYWASAHGHGGPELTPLLMTRLVDLDLTIWFDVYFHGGPPYVTDG